MDNRIIIIARRITSLNSPEIEGIEKGEFFFCTSLGQMFYRDVVSGKITRSGELPTYVPSTVGFSSGPTTFSLFFNSYDNIYLINSVTKIRFSPTVSNATDTAFIKIGSTTYPLLDELGRTVLSNAVLAGSILECVYDGSAFRVMSGGLARKTYTNIDMNYGRI